VLHGALPVAHVARHRLVLPRAPRSLPLADGTDATMEHGTVGRRAAADAKPPHHALEALALAHADDVDDLSLLENLVAGDDVARLHGGGLLEAHLAQLRVRVDAGLLQMTERRLVQPVFLLLAIPDLDRVVAVPLRRLYLHD